ncbi:MAG: PLDc N-terminal domain-containing protein [Elusimicrobia bacterium]|nr:PLDc N-terminal domain-containing protein [Elusimicrobiota bacterium]
MVELILDLWPYIAGALTAALTLVTAAHAILYKRDTRAAAGWVGIIWLAPIAGPVLYILFGINRIRRKASALRSESPQPPIPAPPAQSAEEDLQRSLPPKARHLRSLVKLIDQVVQRPCLPGNRITPLVNGDAAYPAMLDAIEKAEKTVTMATYIFNDGRAGRLFLEALKKAVLRNVAVRVLIDAVGARYSWPPVTRALERSGVPVARFLPTIIPWRMPYLNMRNHRKILVVDGRTAFTGGMNVSDENWLAGAGDGGVQDLHFQIEGPVVGHLQHAFAEDWAFAAGEALQGEAWFPALDAAGTTLARGIIDGPDEDFEKFRWSILGALECAKSSIRIVTPYFLPDQSLITALNVAAMTGIRVDIILPRENNLSMVQWASTHLLWQLLERGCRVWLSPPPFDHTKLMLVDGAWVLIGSANWDPRSLRLNFESNVECYDTLLAETLEALFQAKLQKAHELSLEEVNGRSLPVQLRDGVARLFSPYL